MKTVQPGTVLSVTKTIAKRLLDGESVLVENVGEGADPKALSVRYAALILSVTVVNVVPNGRGVFKFMVKLQ